MYRSDLVDRMMAYESGELTFDETVALFQDLIDSGDVWKLQGSYGRSAMRLIELEYCHTPADEPDPLNGCIHVWAGDGRCRHCGAPEPQ